MDKEGLVILGRTPIGAPVGGTSFRFVPGPTLLTSYSTTVLEQESSTQPMDKEGLIILGRTPIGVPVGSTSFRFWSIFRCQVGLSPSLAFCSMLMSAPENSIHTMDTGTLVYSVITPIGVAGGLSDK